MSEDGDELKRLRNVVKGNSNLTTQRVRRNTSHDRNCCSKKLIVIIVTLISIGLIACGASGVFYYFWNQKCGSVDNIESSNFSLNELDPYFHKQFCSHFKGPLNYFSMSI